MKLYWKDAEGNLQHGSDGDFDPDAIQFSNGDGCIIGKYVAPDGTEWNVPAKEYEALPAREAIIAKLQLSYAAWLKDQPTPLAVESDRVALAREMFAMLKEHTDPLSPRCIPVRQGEVVPPLRLSAHEVHELADGAARLIAATGGAPILRPVGAALKREGQ